MAVIVVGIDAPDGMTLPAQESLEEFRLELGLPVWHIAERGIVLEKRVFMPRWQNTTIVVYTLLAGPPGTCLALRPSFQIRACAAACFSTHQPSGTM